MDPFNTQRRLVLIVDDHADNREVYSTLLEFAGYETLQAEDGEEGVRLARERRPDLVIMDLMMPVLDGWQATERLKRDPGTVDIPVLAVSAFEADPSPEEALRPLGFCGFLPKPAAPRAVLSAVERCISLTAQGVDWVALPLERRL